MMDIKPDSSDDEVLEAANATEAVLVTRDKGFGEMVFRQGLAAHGVLLLRLAGIPLEERKKLLVDAVGQHGPEFVGAFSVLTRSGLRVRPRFPDRT